jgi:hypothetical protein
MREIQVNKFSLSHHCLRKSRVNKIFWELNTTHSVFYELTQKHLNPANII